MVRSIEELQAIARRCDRVLFGHGLELPHDVLTRLAASTSPDEVGDVYGSGALIADFEQRVAEILGKEAAVFMPSGTMAQQIALRIWCDRAGKHMVGFHPTCHLELHEQKGYDLLHGLHGRLVGDRQNLLSLKDLHAVPEALGVLLLELPQREIGGQLPQWDELQAQLAWARERDIYLHMDGARLWEAAPFYERSPAQIAEGFDTVYVSFYKGIGAIAGAALAGPQDVMDDARIWLRRHGGNLIHLYPYVLSARMCMDQRLDKFAGYYDRACAIARALTAVPGVYVKPDPPQTNMMHVYVPGKPDALMDASLDIAERDGFLAVRQFRETDVPGYSMFELSVGDAAENVTDSEITRAFAHIVSATG